MRQIWTGCWWWKRRLGLLALGHLAGREEAGARAHLASCLSCREHFASLTTLAAHLEQLGQDVPELDPSPALRHRWQMALDRRETEATGTTRSESAASAGVRTIDWFAGGRRGWAAAGLCWLLVAVFRWTAPEVDGPSGTTPGIPLATVLWLLEDGTSPMAGAGLNERGGPGGRPDRLRPPRWSERMPAGDFLQLFGLRETRALRCEAPAASSFENSKLRSWSSSSCVFVLEQGRRAAFQTASEAEGIRV